MNVTAQVTAEAQRGAMNSLGNEMQDAVIFTGSVLLGAITANASTQAALLVTAVIMLVASIAFTRLASTFCNSDVT